MSDCAESSSTGNSHKDASPGDKPRYVRRLNFAPLILELDTVEQASTTLNRGLFVDQNVAHIPCTSKSDYVRKWIEIHENSSACNLTDELPDSVFRERSAIKTVETSPIIGSNWKQRRRRIYINRQAAAKSANNADCQKNVEHSANCRIPSEPDCENGGNSETGCTPPTEQMVGNESSPVLGAFSRKRKRNSRILEDVTSLKRLKFPDEANINVNPMIESDNLDSSREVSTGCEKVEEHSNTNIEASLFSIGTEKNLELSKAAFSSSQRLQERVTDSSSDNTNEDNLRIEIGMSNDEEITSNDGKCYKISSTQNDSDNNLSNIIEDTDTQEIIRTSQRFVPDKSFVPSKQFTPSQLAIDNETYCYEAEMLQAQSSHLSAQISEVPSLQENTQKTGNTSIQSDLIISSITTPSKKSPNRTMQAHLLDSGKKRRKSKKGSMVAKLQSLINAQISGIRIWHYRMNKNLNDAASVEFISVLVCSCKEQFGNQFLDGILIEDRFNLLQDDAAIEGAESRNSQVPETQPKRSPRRNITVMLVCDIVGTLKMKSKVVINVYPPWNILDKNDLTLEATYVSISDNCKISDILNENYPRKYKKRVIKEFNCPCIEEQRELPFCARKPNGDKPDVMQRIFDF